MGIAFLSILVYIAALVFIICTIASPGTRIPFWHDPKNLNHVIIA